MKERMMLAHMEVAEIYAKLSYAKRLQVGAIIVKDDRIISIGYNGMPSGWDNNCEDKIPLPQKEISPGVIDLLYRYELKTKPEVLHAEANAISKLARSTESGFDSALFVTHSPCLDCAKLVFQSGINSVYYRNSYRNEDGLQFLEKCNIKVKKI